MLSQLMEDCPNFIKKLCYGFIKTLLHIYYRLNSQSKWFECCHQGGFKILNCQSNPLFIIMDIHFWHYHLPFIELSNNIQLRMKKSCATPTITSFCPPRVISPIEHQNSFVSTSTVHQSPSSNHSKKPDLTQSQVLNKIRNMKPFQSMNPEDNFQQYLNEVYAIQRQKGQSQSSMNSHFAKTFTAFKGKNSKSSSDFNQQCNFILQPQSKNESRYSIKNKRKVNKKRMVKSDLTLHKSVENQVATLFIEEMKNDRRQFRKSIKRFHTMIEQAEYEFVNQSTGVVHPHNGPFVSLIHKPTVTHTYVDEQPGLQRFKRKKACGLQNINKYDVYTFIKNKDKILNIDYPKEVVLLTKRVQSSVNQFSQTIYKKYMRNFIARRQIIKERAKLS